MRLYSAAILIAGALAASASADDSKVDGKKLKVEVAKGKVEINGKAVAFPGELKDLEKLFGKPSGSIKDPVDDANKYIFWNGLGIQCSQSTKGKQPVQELLFGLEPGYDLSAKALAKPFPGQIAVEGVKIGRSTPKADVQKIKLGHDFVGSWTITYEDSPIQVVINPSDKGTKSVRILQRVITR